MLRFELCSGQTNKQTDSNIIPTLTNRVGLDKNTECYFHKACSIQ